MRGSLSLEYRIDLVDLRRSVGRLRFRDGEQNTLVVRKVSGRLFRRQVESEEEEDRRHRFVAE